MAIWPICILATATDTSKTRNYCVWIAALCGSGILGTGRYHRKRPFKFLEIKQIEWLQTAMSGHSEVPANILNSL